MEVWFEEANINDQFGPKWGALSSQILGDNLVQNIYTFVN